jgi:hypothetical protein
VRGVRQLPRLAAEEPAHGDEHRRGVNSGLSPGNGRSDPLTKLRLCRLRDSPR